MQEGSSRPHLDAFVAILAQAHPSASGTESFLVFVCLSQVFWRRPRRAPSRKAADASREAVKRRESEEIDPQEEAAAEAAVGQVRSVGWVSLGRVAEGGEVLDVEASFRWN